MNFKTRSKEFPAIYDDRIVWQDNRNGNWDIFMYDLPNKKESQITANELDQVGPIIYGDRIVWEDGRNGSSDIYMCNLSSTQLKHNTQDLEQNNGSAAANIEQTPEQTASPSMPGFEIVSGIICLVQYFTNWIRKSSIPITILNI